MQDKDRRRSSAQTLTHYQIAVHRVIPHRATIWSIKIPIISDNMTMIKILIMLDKMIRCKRKCRNSRTKTSISTEAAQSAHKAKHLAPVAMIDRHKDRIHFSKCNNNQLFKGGRISLKGSGSSTIKHIIRWTSRTRPIHHNHPTHHLRIQGRVVDRHLPRKKTSILVIMQIRCAPLAPWAQPKDNNSAKHLVPSNWRHSCRVEAARHHQMCKGKAS